MINDFESQSLFGRRISAIGFVSLLSLAMGCGPGDVASGSNSKPLSVFVAASTVEPMEEISQMFQAETGLKVVIAPGPSSGLAKQIEQGAPCDMFLSADQASANFLADKGRVGKRRNLLGNRLVVIAPADRQSDIRTLNDLADSRIAKLALAESAVPAGKYARQALQKGGIWGEVERKVVSGIDVRATTQFVARGEADAGIVYYTDAAATLKVRIALEIPSNMHEPIEYPVILIRQSIGRNSAEQFYQFLSTEKASTVFRRFHFEIKDLRQ